MPETPEQQARTLDELRAETELLFEQEGCEVDRLRITALTAGAEALKGQQEEIENAFEAGWEAAMEHTHVGGGSKSEAFAQFLRSRAEREE